MIMFFLEGFATGFSYVSPLGPQNIWLIKSSLYERLRNIVVTVFSIIFFDTTLALLCYFGVGSFLQLYPLISNYFVFFSGIYVVFLGYEILNESNQLELKKNNLFNLSVCKIMLKSFVLTMLNPQALIDGSILLGSIGQSLESSHRLIFFSGFLLASMSWFIFLSMTFYLLKNKVNFKIFMFIKNISSILMIFIGFKLIFGSLNSFYEIYF